MEEVRLHLYQKLRTILLSVMNLTNRQGKLVLKNTWENALVPLYCLFRMKHQVRKIIAINEIMKL